MGVYWQLNPGLALPLSKIPSPLTRFLKQLLKSWFLININVILIKGWSAWTWEYVSLFFFCGGGIFKYLDTYMVKDMRKANIRYCCSLISSTHSAVLVAYWSLYPFLLFCFLHQLWLEYLLIILGYFHDSSWMGHLKSTSISQLLISS